MDLFVDICLDAVVAVVCCTGNSWVQEPHCRWHELSMPLKSISSVDARHALQLCEMSRVVLRLRRVFCGSSVQSLSQCHTSRMPRLEVTVET